MEKLTKIRLYQLPSKFKLLLLLTVINLTAGVGIGLYYVANTTQLSPEGTTEHFSGSEINEEFDIPEKYPKPISELLTTTHNHIISMTFIFFILGGIFYFNSIISKIHVNIDFVIIIENRIRIFLLQYFKFD